MKKVLLAITALSLTILGYFVVVTIFVLLIGHNAVQQIKSNPTAAIIQNLILGIIFIVGYVLIVRYLWKRYK